MSRLAYTFKGGRVIDPANKVDEVRDLHVIDGLVSESPIRECEVIDVTGKVVSPGLIDMHVHLREPGQSAKETIRTGTEAAAAGGFTSVVCMPNTTPVVDNASTIAWIKEKAADEAVVNVFPTGSISQEMRGELLSPIGSLARAGAVAITDAGLCIQDNELMRRALEYSRMFDLPVMDHCRDNSLTHGAMMNEGYWSMVLGLPGWPAVAEELMMSRNAILSEFTETRVHCQQLSCAGSVRTLREARSRGVKISGEVCPHHITLTDACLEDFNPNFKMNPPLRSQEDMDGLLEGIADGTIGYLCSAHAPHCDYEKEVEFDEAPFGIVGLETELGIFLTELVHKKVIDLPRLIEILTVCPSELLGLERGSLGVGEPADVTVLDPDVEWTVDKETFLSKGQNTPFHGRELKGRAVMTMVSGDIVWSLESGLHS